MLQTGSWGKLGGKWGWERREEKRGWAWDWEGKRKAGVVESIATRYVVMPSLPVSHATSPITSSPASPPLHSSQLAYRLFTLILTYSQWTCTVKYHWLLSEYRCRVVN